MSEWIFMNEFKYYVFYSAHNDRGSMIGNAEVVRRFKIEGRRLSNDSTQGDKR